MEANGSLPVLYRDGFNIPGGPASSTGSFAGATSNAKVSVSILQPQSLTAPQSCSFGSGLENNCVINTNGTPSASDTYAQWSTPGFSVGNKYLPASWVFPLTGPLTYYINLNRLNLQNAGMQQVLETIEPLVHVTLINSLSSLTSFAYIQDPGNINLAVVDQNGLSSGILPNGTKTYDIPGSMVYDSAMNPGVLFPNPKLGSWYVLITGKNTGSYQVAASTIEKNVGGQAIDSGLIAAGQSIGYRVVFSKDSLGSSTRLLSRAPFGVGDLNGDGSVNCADIGIVRKAIGTRSGSVGFNAWADVVADNVIDIRDIAYISQKTSPGTRCQ